MELKFKKLHPDAVTPTKAYEGDAGFDLTPISYKLSDDYTFIEYKTGLALEIPSGYVGLIYPRSSISRVQQVMCNSVAVIDSGFRGEILLRFRLTGRGANIEPKIYKAGEKIAQLVIMPIPQIELVEVDELTESDRGEGGFGSTGI